MEAQESEHTKEWFLQFQGERQPPASRELFHNLPLRSENGGDDGYLGRHRIFVHAGSVILPKAATLISLSEGIYHGFFWRGVRHGFAQYLCLDQSESGKYFGKVYHQEWDMDSLKRSFEVADLDDVDETSDSCTRRTLKTLSLSQSLRQIVSKSQSAAEAWRDSGTADPDSPLMPGDIPRVWSPKQQRGLVVEYRKFREQVEQTLRTVRRQMKETIEIEMQRRQLLDRWKFGSEVVVPSSSIQSDKGVDEYAHADAIAIPKQVRQLYLLRKFIPEAGASFEGEGYHDYLWEAKGRKIIKAPPHVLDSGLMGRVNPQPQRLQKLKDDLRSWVREQIKITVAKLPAVKDDLDVAIVMVWEDAEESAAEPDVVVRDTTFRVKVKRKRGTEKVTEDERTMVDRSVQKVFDYSKRRKKPSDEGRDVSTVLLEMGLRMHEGAGIWHTLENEFDFCLHKDVEFLEIESTQIPVNPDSDNEQGEGDHEVLGQKQTKTSRTWWKTILTLGFRVPAPVGFFLIFVFVMCIGLGAFVAFQAHRKRQDVRNHNQSGSAMPSEPIGTAIGSASVAEDDGEDSVDSDADVDEESGLITSSSLSARKLSKPEADVDEESGLTTSSSLSARKLSKPSPYPTSPTCTIPTYPKKAPYPTIPTLSDCTVLSLRDFGSESFHSSIDTSSSGVGISDIGSSKSSAFWYPPEIEGYAARYMQQKREEHEEKLLKRLLKRCQNQLDCLDGDGHPQTAAVPLADVSAVGSTNSDHNPLMVVERQLMDRAALLRLRRDNQGKGARRQKSENSEAANVSAADPDIGCRRPSVLGGLEKNNKKKYPTHTNAAEWRIPPD